MERRYQLLAPAAVMGGHYADQTLEETCPWGLDGGAKGKPAAVVFNPGKTDERHMRGKEVGYELREGDTWLLRGSGGGGYGCRRSETAEHVADDLRNGYITPTRRDPSTPLGARSPHEAGGDRRWNDRAGRRGADSGASRVSSALSAS